MRTLLLLLGTIVLLAGGFVGYWFFQRPDASHLAGAHEAALHKPMPIEKGDSATIVHGSKGVWLKEFDQNGRLKSRFRADDAIPQKEGYVRVTKPEAHFFLSGGQWIRVTGETGDVYINNMPEKGDDPFASSNSAAPSRGSLRTVHLQLYDAPDATTPTLDMDMNNAAFDNESFRIYTEAYTDVSGKHVPADQVKVTVRGKYDFDGRGLTIRWNDRDRRLELLEIAHGERLIVKEPGALGMKKPQDNKPGPQRAEKNRVPFEKGTQSFSPLALASADAGAGAAVAAASDNPKRDSTIYEIWFYDNVQVLQNEKTLATGNTITVFYASKDNEEKPSTTRKSTTTAPAKAGAPAQGESAKLQAASQPTGESAKAPATTQVAMTQVATTQPTTGPAATQPSDQGPVTIYWTGKLRMIPTQNGPPAAVQPGQSVVQMIGTPVVLTRENVQIRCPSFVYRDADDRVNLLHSKEFPQVEIKQFATNERTGKPDLTLVSETIDYEPAIGVATMFGKSRADFPADAAKQSPETASATWDKQGVAHFKGSGSDAVIESLLLTGDVDVRHPQVSLKSQRLNLTFEPPDANATPVAAKTVATKTGAAATRPEPSKQPVVKQVFADDAVHCVLVDETGGTRVLDGDHLDLTTAKDPAGNLYPKFVNASGKVTAKEQGSTLNCEELAMQLAPAKAKPSAAGAAAAGVKPAPAVAAANTTATTSTAAVELQTLTARTHVRATSDKGDVATGDKLVVTMAYDGTPHVDLTGKTAQVRNEKGSVLTSTHIVVPNRDEQQALGPGTLVAPVEDDNPPPPAGAKPRMMNVSWTGSAQMNGKLKENQVRVTGNVKAVIPEQDGTVNTATADLIYLTLTDKPGAASTQPTTKSAKPQAAGTDSTIASTDIGAMNGKQVSQVILSKDAVVDSKRSAVDGSVLHETRIESQLLQYDLLTKHLTVPRAGTMIVRDHTPPDEKPKQPADSDGLSTQKGATAFKWAKSLDYNGTDHRAIMRGDVLVVYKPDDAKELPVRVRSDEVVATFEDAPSKGGAAAPQQQGGNPLAGGMNGPSAQLRSVRCEGNVSVIRGEDELTGPRLTYDPQSHWLRAMGTDQTPAVFTSGPRASGVTAHELQWNTQTWMMKAVDVTGRAAGTR